jgi:hypothetical protein
VIGTDGGSDAMGGLGFYNKDYNASQITIGSAGTATIRGGVIAIAAGTSAEHEESETPDGFYKFESAYSFFEKFNFLAATSFTTTSAIVTVGSSASISGQTVVISADAKVAAIGAAVLMMPMQLGPHKTKPWASHSFLSCA